MRFLILTHVQHKLSDGQYYAYAPYVREMNIWLKYVDEVEIVSPINNDLPQTIDLEYHHSNISHTKIPEIAFVTIKRALKSIIQLPEILKEIYRACKRADHIHLRCPGNIGLLGCLVQIAFPKKVKTAKYAGNWDPKSKQPLSYRFQKWLLGNTFLTKNIKVLVYGEWKNQTKNIIPFFTASYFKSEIENIKLRDYSVELKFMFVGSLVKGKRPLLAVKVVEELNKIGKHASLQMYGEGVLKDEIQLYIQQNSLSDKVFVHGNQNQEVVKSAYKKSHFCILLSKSEGWPKALAESMFFGCIPIATKISCIPYMLDNGGRGLLVQPDVKNVVENIFKQTTQEFYEMSSKCTTWSQQFTLDYFKNSIEKLIN